jgi:RNA polymerase sigma-70 factor (ECF subfamily)
MGLREAAAAGTESRGTVARLPLESATDRVLVEASLRGDRSSQGTIFRRYHPLVRTIVCRSLGVRDAPDVVQEVFMRLFRNLATLRDPEALKAFVTGISVRVVRSELRSRRVREIISYGDVDTPSGAAESSELVVGLYRDLAKLDDEARLAFILRHVQGMTLPEVAEYLECSLATAKRRLAVAMDALGESLGKEVDGD